MKSIQYIIFFLFFECLFIMASCNDKEDTEAPEISILSPQNNEVFNVGDTINIHFEVTENDELHHINADLLDEESNKLWHRHWHSHLQFFEWQDQFIVDESEAGKILTFKVTADDHNGNESEAMILITIE